MLYQFLRGESKNINGLYIDDIWHFSYEELESKHNFIQWIFPIRERSAFNIFLPIVTDGFDTNDEIKENMLKSFSVMLGFYGFAISDNEIIKQNFEERSKIWLKPKNHNFLRISRILKSLCIFGLEEYAKKFYDVMISLSYEYKDIISEENILYWSDAISNN